MERTASFTKNILEKKPILSVKCQNLHSVVSSNGGDVWIATFSKSSILDEMFCWGLNTPSQSKLIAYTA